MKRRNTPEVIIEEWLEMSMRTFINTITIYPDVKQYIDKKLQEQRELYILERAADWRPELTDLVKSLSKQMPQWIHKGENKGSSNAKMEMKATLDKNTKKFNVIKWMHQYNLFVDRFELTAKEQIISIQAGITVGQEIAATISGEIQRREYLQINRDKRVQDVIYWNICLFKILARIAVVYGDITNETEKMMTIGNWRATGSEVESIRESFLELLKLFHELANETQTFQLLKTTIIKALSGPGASITAIKIGQGIKQEYELKDAISRNVSGRPLSCSVEKFIRIVERVMNKAILDRNADNRSNGNRQLSNRISQNDVKTDTRDYSQRERHDENSKRRQINSTSISHDNEESDCTDESNNEDDTNTVPVNAVQRGNNKTINSYQQNRNNYTPERKPKQFVFDKEAWDNLPDCKECGLKHSKRKRELGTCPNTLEGKAINERCIVKKKPQPTHVFVRLGRYSNIWKNLPEKEQHQVV
jgi:hypothetical protein